MNYRETIKQYRHQGVYRKEGRIVTPKLSEIGIVPKINRGQSWGWEVLNRVRERHRAVKYPWSDNVVAVMQVQRPPVVHHKATPLPPWRIDCSVCENYGSIHCTKNLDGEAVKAGKRQPQTVTFEFKQKPGAAYIDASFDLEDVTFNKDGSVTVSDFPSGIHMPLGLNRDTYSTYYSSPEYIELMIANRGIRSYRLPDLQRMVWIPDRQGDLYLFRLKDLSPNGGVRQYSYRSKPRPCKDCNGKGYTLRPMTILDPVSKKGDPENRIPCPYCTKGWVTPKWQGPNMPRCLSFHVPLEIYRFIVHPQGTTVNIHGIHGSTKGHWEKVGSLSEEQALAKLGQGPRVQPGKLLDTVPLYEETDIDPDFDSEEAWDSLDNENFRMEEAS